MNIIGFIFNYSPGASWSKPPSPAPKSFYFIVFKGHRVYNSPAGNWYVFDQRILKKCNISFFTLKKSEIKLGLSPMVLDWIRGNEKIRFEKLAVSVCLSKSFCLLVFASRAV